MFVLKISHINWPSGEQGGVYSKSVQEGQGQSESSSSVLSAQG